MFKRILIVADDAALASELGAAAETLGAAPLVSATAAEAVARLGLGPSPSDDAARFDLCLVDLALPAGEAAAVVLKAGACAPPIPTVALGDDDGEGAGAVEALRAGACEVVGRRACAARLHTLLRPRDEGAARRNAPGALIIGDHPRIRHALAEVDRIAGLDGPMLFGGETGTGKETLARLVHGASARRDRPFVAVNLAGIPTGIVESELLGQPGGRADRERSRAGWVPAARGGTLYLEDVDDLPPALQARLADVLAGGLLPSAEGPVDVRVAAAVSTPLAELREADRFDAGLAAIFERATVALPPLRERREDIPALAEHFRRQVNAREGRRVPGFALDVMRRLTRHDWPGNVRELENVVERLVVTAGARMVVMKDLPAHLRISVVELGTHAPALPPDGLNLRGMLTELEERIIAEALARADGDRGRAARLLGLDRADLIEKLRRRYVA